MYKYIDRKHENTLLLLPGWGFDWRIFGTLELPYNYLFLPECTYASWENTISKALQETGVENISIFGSSQGASMAYLFAAANSERVDELILVGIKRKHDKDKLLEIRGLLNRNCKAYLRQFYKACFGSNENSSYAWFRKTLQNVYFEQMSLRHLIEGLEWLEQAEIDPRKMESNIYIKIVHGEQDQIAPVNEAIELEEILPNSELILIENGNHLPFLQNGFKERI